MSKIMAFEHRNYVDVHAQVFPDFYASAMQAAGLKDVDGWPAPKWSVEAMLDAMDNHNASRPTYNLVTM